MNNCMFSSFILQESNIWSTTATYSKSQLLEYPVDGGLFKAGGYVFGTMISSERFIASIEMHEVTR